MGRQLPPLAAAAALGEALTCPPEFLELDFPEVGAATTGVDGDNGDDDDDDAGVNFPPSAASFSVPPSPLSSAARLLPLFDLLVLAS
jgi:hypothetical protein